MSRLPALLALLVLVGTDARTRAAESTTPSGVAGSSGSTPSSAAPTATVPVDASPTADAGTAQTADEAFTARVKTTEEQVSDLKEKIFRTKARLLLLQESVLGGDLASGARAVIVHKNDMGSTFLLESVSYALDGAPIFTKVDNQGDLAQQKELEVFSGRIVPGQHQLSVRMVYRGHGYGVFSYLEGYKFKLQNSFTFNAEGGRVSTIKVVGHEKGGVTTDLKDRPNIRFDMDVTRDQKPVQASAGGK